MIKVAKIVSDGKKAAIIADDATATAVIVELRKSEENAEGTVPANEPKTKRSILFKIPVLSKLSSILKRPYAEYDKSFAGLRRLFAVEAGDRKLKDIRRTLAGKISEPLRETHLNGWEKHPLIKELAMAGLLADDSVMSSPKLHLFKISDWNGNMAGALIAISSPTDPADEIASSFFILFRDDIFLPLSFSPAMTDGCERVHCLSKGNFRISF